MLFLSTVSLISRGVFFYSGSYMQYDPLHSRFIFLLTLFVLSIRILILSPNFIRILLGWDGLGVTSYLLVIYFQSGKSFNAGIITALTNRLGDVGLLLTIGLTTHAGRWAFFYYGCLSGWLRSATLILLVLTASTKRAQIPFSS